MKQMGESMAAALDEYVKQSEERGYYLAIWDGDGEQYRAIKGQANRAIRKLTIMLAHAIVYSMKEECLEMDNLREVLGDAKKELTFYALEFMEARMGRERFAESANTYFMKKTADGKAEEVLAEMIGKDAKGDDGSGEV